MTSRDKSELERKIKRKAESLGMNIVKFANVERWSEYKDVPPAYWPQTIWLWSVTVISMAVQIFPSMLETTPSCVYSELYNTTNRYLDEAAYKLANYLNRLGYRSTFPSGLLRRYIGAGEKAEAAFSHVIAAKYAGVGTIGMNHTLVCPVGDDKKLYGKSSVSPEGIEHCRSFGSKNAVE